ncbi:MAG: deoxyribodipyrimidine photo-lyase, partial [Gammaproteobacteria bacterium]|nr:deoxyribodipyrimidine photo-lyase [Gammaproteobacteria bacterium]
MQKIAIYWCRRDFRLQDNPALFAAYTCVQNEGALLIPLFVLEDYMVQADPNEQFAYASRYFLWQALPRFASQFHRFTIIQGKGAKTLIQLASKLGRESGRDCTIFVNDDIDKHFYKQVDKIRSQNIAIQVCNDALTIAKNTSTVQGSLYSVFTPFKNRVWQAFCTCSVFQKIEIPSPKAFFLEDFSQGFSVCAPDSLQRRFSHNRLVSIGSRTYDLEQIMPQKIDYPIPYRDEKEAQQQLSRFIHQAISQYTEQRNHLHQPATSHLSLALTWGLVSSRTIVEELRNVFNLDLQHPDHAGSPGHITYVTELLWREFYRYLLLHYPELNQQAFQKKYNLVVWEENALAHSRWLDWVKGLTGYPIVDAAMMQIAQTGWMHNRARMIVASILTKNLGVDWRWGQEYFRAMLLDLDEASNIGGWQWGASVGADPKPIRIFNPYLQAKKYDSHSQYMKTYLSSEYFKNPP